MPNGDDPYKDPENEGTENGDIGEESSNFEQPGYTGSPTSYNMGSPLTASKHHVINARHIGIGTQSGSNEVHIYINEKATNTSSTGWDFITSFVDITTGSDAGPPNHNQLIGSLYRLKYEASSIHAVKNYAHWRTYLATFNSGDTEEFEVLVPGWFNSKDYIWNSSSVSYAYEAGGCNQPNFPVNFGSTSYLTTPNLSLYQFIQTNIIDNASGIWSNGASYVALGGVWSDTMLKLNGGATDNFYLANFNGGGVSAANVPVGTQGKQKISSIVANIDSVEYSNLHAYLASNNYVGGATLNWSALMSSLIYGSLGPYNSTGFAFEYYVEYTEYLPTCDATIYNINACSDPNSMAFWQHVRTDCDGVAIPTAVLLNPNLATFNDTCCPDCINTAADGITYSYSPLTLSVTGHDPITQNGTEGYIDVTILDGGFDANGVPQGLPTGTANYTYVIKNQDILDTMCGNTAGLAVGSGAVANTSFTFGNTVTLNPNGGLLQTGAIGTATYAISSANGYVPVVTGTTNSEGFRAGCYDVYVFDASATVCLGRTTVCLIDPKDRIGCTDTNALNYDSLANIANNTTCHYCDAATGELVDGQTIAQIVAPISTSSGSPFTITNPTNTTATDGSITISGLSPTATFQSYINDIVDGSSIQNADYKIELYKWTAQNASGSFAASSIVGSVINNQGNGWNVTLNSSSLAGTFTYGYYSIKVYVDDPDSSSEQEQCYEILDVIVPVPACVESVIGGGWTATAADGVVVTDPNLYVHDSLLCNIVNRYCCDDPIFKIHASNTVCDLRYESLIYCTDHSASFLTYALQYYDNGSWIDIGSPVTIGTGGGALLSSPYTTGPLWTNSVFSIHGNGKYRVKWKSQYINSPDCTVYSNEEIITLGVWGCGDINALNYNPTANCDDNSCIYCIYGCMDPTASNYNIDATCDDGSCYRDVYGCTDISASNYNPLANIDDGSCEYLPMGCTDLLAINYDPIAQVDDGSCEYCEDPPMAVTTSVTDATVTTGTCIANSDGCIHITVESTTCTSTWTLVECFFFCGISNSNVNLVTATDYSYGVQVNICSLPPKCLTLTLEDCNGCQMQITVCIGTSGAGCGCTDPAADNYNSSATIDDGSCQYCGCTDSTAINYNPSATSNCIPDTCEYPSLLPPCIPPDIEQVFEKLKLCIAENGFHYYTKLVTGQSDDCSTMDVWKLILMDYLLRKMGLDCIYNCADINTPDASKAFITCSDLWITGGPNTGLNDTAVAGTGVGTTSTVDMFYTSGTLSPGDVIKHHNSENIWIFYGPEQNGPPAPVSVVGLDPENASGNLSGYWAFCNDSMRYTNENNINYIDKFINFANKFCADCGNKPELSIGSSSNITIQTLNQGIDGIDNLEI